MSRIGKQAIAVPSGVTVTINGQDVAVKGPKGQLALTLIDDIDAQLGDNGVVVETKSDTKRGRSMWGMSRTLVNNMIVGVSDGFNRELEINGVGYRAQVQGKNLQLQLGYSHEIKFPIPDGIDVKCEKPTSISISGIDKQKVGQVAAKIRGYRPPEPYKGKGVKYADEHIFRKEGKKK
jgi:large subunit ribosomal protein L6